MLSPVLASFEIADSHGKQEGRKEGLEEPEERDHGYAVGSTLFPLLGLRSVADRERRGDYRVALCIL